LAEVGTAEKLTRSFSFIPYEDISYALKSASTFVNIPALGYAITGLLRILSDIRLDLVQLEQAMKYNLPHRIVIKFITTFFQLDYFETIIYRASLAPLDDMFYKEDGFYLVD